MIKRILKAINDHAQAITDIMLGDYQPPLGPDTRQACRHCGQNVSDRNINHASTGCTVNVREQ